MKHEYMVETLIINELPDVKRIEELAVDGWELLNVVAGQMVAPYCARVATSFYYKRPINT